MTDRAPFHVLKGTAEITGVHNVMLDEPVKVKKGWWFATSRDGVGVVEPASAEEAADLDERYPHTGEFQVYVPNTRLEGDA